MTDRPYIVKPPRGDFTLEERKFREGLVDGNNVFFKNWTPTLAASAGNYTSTTITVARYAQIGSLVCYYIQVTGTTSGTPAYLSATLPVTPHSSYDAWTAGKGEDVGSNVSITARVDGGDPGIRAYRHDFANFGTGAGCGFKLSGFYEIA